MIRNPKEREALIGAVTAAVLELVPEVMVRWRRHPFGVQVELSIVLGRRLANYDARKVYALGHMWDDLEIATLINPRGEAARLAGEFARTVEDARRELAKADSALLE